MGSKKPAKNPSGTGKARKKLALSKETLKDLTVKGARVKGGGVRKASGACQQQDPTE